MNAQEVLRVAEQLKSVPSTTHLRDHLQALVAISNVGGEEYVEAPIEQCRAWRLLLVDDMQSKSPEENGDGM